MKQSLAAGCLVAFLILVGSVATRAGDDSLAIADLFNRLGAERYTEREAAQERLIALGKQAVPGETLMRPAIEVYGNSTDPEVRYRVRQVIFALFETHYLDRPRGFLGIRFNLELTAPDGQPSVKIQSVSEGSAAETVGLQAGDQIIKVGDLDLDNVESAGKFAPYVQSHAPGETLSLVVVRGDQQLVLSPTLDALPPPERQRLYPPEQRSRLFDTWLREQLKSKE